MNILVTGGAGFIGSRLVEKLATFARITVLDSLDSQVHLEKSFSSALQTAAQCHHGDIRNNSVYDEFIDEIDVVVHLASHTGTGQSMYEMARYVSNNAFGTARLLDVIVGAKHKPLRIILASSRAVYGEGVYENDGRLCPVRRSLENLKSRAWEPVDQRGEVVRPLPMCESHPTNPTSVYGMTKLWQEQLVQNVCEARNIDYAILRFQNVFGPGQALNNPYSGIVGTVSRSILADEPVELFEDGQITRDFIFVGDAVAAVEAAVRHDASLQGIYNIGSGVATSLISLVDRVGALTGKKPRVHCSGRFRLGDVRHAVADTTRFRATFSVPLPTSIEEGLEAYMAWLRKQPKLDAERHESALMEMTSHGMMFQAT